MSVIFNGTNLETSFNFRLAGAPTGLIPEVEYEMVSLPAANGGKVWRGYAMPGELVVPGVIDAGTISALMTNIGALRTLVRGRTSGTLAISDYSISLTCKIIGANLSPITALWVPCSITFAYEDYA